MRNKRLTYLVLILLLTVGFATVSTSLFLSGSVNISTNKNDFDVYFSGAEIDNVDVSNQVIQDKKHIIYRTDELKTKDDTSTLLYEVTNDSTEYDANVTISCTPMKTEYVEVTLDPVSFDIEAGEVESGKITAKLLKVSKDEQNIFISCELTVKALPKTEVAEIVEHDNNYKISGVLKDKDNNSIEFDHMLIKSESQIIKTGKNGYFYVEGLERGIHHIYYKEDGDYELSDSELNNYLIAEVSTNGHIKMINKNYKITNFQHRLDLEDEGIYCQYEEGQVWDFPYNGTNGTDGSRQYLTIPCTAVYKLEVWGAQGGTVNSTYIGGYGGYSTGDLKILDGTKIFVYVGGSTSSTSGGYNGGANGDGDGRYQNGYALTGRGGGGATHIAFKDNLLKDLESYQDKVLIVAAGGGGAAIGDQNYSKGGNAGGYQGGYSTTNPFRGGTESQYPPSEGGSQYAGGNIIYPGSFGQGGDGRSWSGGGGSGWYGGAGGCGTGGGGGSSYTKSSLENNFMYCFNCLENDGTVNKNFKTISTTSNTVGVDKTNCPSGVSSNEVSRCAKAGDGHARITLISFD